MPGDSAGNYILGEGAYRHLETTQRGYPLIADKGLGAAYSLQAATAMEAGVATIEFWHAAAGDRRIGAAFRAICKFNGKEPIRLQALAA